MREQVNPSAASKQLLSVQLDRKSRENPESIYARIPKGANLEDGYKDVTYGQLGKAVDRMCWWLDSNMKNSNLFETIGYIGESDIRYPILILAAMKTRRTIFTPLLSNSLDAHLNLLKSIDCRVLCAPSRSMHYWDAVREARPDLRILIMPEVEVWLEEGPCKHYSYVMDYEEAKNDPVYINHTSGSTGLPKKVVNTNAMLRNGERDRELSTDGTGHESCLEWVADSSLLITLPISWSLSLTLVLITSFSHGLIPVFLPATAPFPMTASYANLAHQLAPADAGVYVPSVLAEIAHNPAYLKNMANMHTVFFGGAPLQHAAGNILSRVMNVQPIIGTTEAMSIGLEKATREDWMYYSFQPRSGSSFVPFSEEDGLWEMVIVRNPDPDYLQNIFHFYDNGGGSDADVGLPVFHSRDLYTKHPSKPGLWLSAGRADDFVKLKTLTKFNARHVESIIEKHPRVKSATMGGDGRAVPFLVLELGPSTEPGAPKDHHSITSNPVDQENELLGDTWTAIEEANHVGVAEIAIRKDMFIIASAEKPIKRTFKSTVDRRRVLLDYEDEVKQLYARYEAL